MAAQSLLHSQKCSSYICHKPNCRYQNPWRNFWAGYENHQVGQQRQHSQLQTGIQCQDQIIRKCKKIRRGKFDAHQTDFAERTKPWFMDILNSCRSRRDHCSVDLSQAGTPFRFHHNPSSKPSRRNWTDFPKCLPESLQKVSTILTIDHQWVKLKFCNFFDNIIHRNPLYINAYPSKQPRILRQNGDLSKNSSTSG